MNSARPTHQLPEREQINATQCPKELETAVFAQMERITVCRLFKRSAQLQKLLGFLVRETLAGRGQDLSQYVIGTKLFAIAAFDPEESTLVRAHARRLRKALVEYYMDEGADDPVHIAIDPGSYMTRFQFRAVKGSEQKFPVKGIGNRDLPTVAIFEPNGFNLDGAWVNVPTLIAEELCIQLADQDCLRLLGPLCQVEAGTRSPRPLALARKYGADFLLDGGVERTNGKLIVRFLLRTTESSEVIWHRRIVFDESEPRVAIETMVTASMLNEIANDYGVIPAYVCEQARQKPTRSLNLNEAILVAREFQRSFTEDAFNKGREALRHAIDKEPRSGSLHGALAILLFGGYCEPFTRGETLLPELQSAAEIAFRLSPTAPWSRAAACMAPLLAKDYAKLECRANAISHASGFPRHVSAIVGCIMIYGGVRVRNASRLIQASIDQNPHYPRVLNFALALTCLKEKRWKRMNQYADEYDCPSDWGYHLVRLLAVLGLDQTEEVDSRWCSLLEVFPDFERRGLNHMSRFLHPDYVDATRDLLVGSGLLDGEKIRDRVGLVSCVTRPSLS